MVTNVLETLDSQIVKRDQAEQAAKEKREREERDFLDRLFAMSPVEIEAACKKLPGNLSLETVRDKVTYIDKVRRAVIANAELSTHSSRTDDTMAFCNAVIVPNSLEPQIVMRNERQEMLIYESNGTFQSVGIEQRQLESVTKQLDGDEERRIAALVSPKELEAIRSLSAKIQECWRLQMLNRFRITRLRMELSLDKVQMKYGLFPDPPMTGPTGALAKMLQTELEQSIEANEAGIEELTKDNGELDASIAGFREQIKRISAKIVLV